MDNRIRRVDREDRDLARMRAGRERRRRGMERQFAAAAANRELAELREEARRGAGQGAHRPPDDRREPNPWVMFGDDVVGLHQNVDERFDDMHAQVFRPFLHEDRFERRRRERRAARDRARNERLAARNAEDQRIMQANRPDNVEHQRELRDLVRRGRHHDDFGQGRQVLIQRPRHRDTDPPGGKPTDVQVCGMCKSEQQMQHFFKHIYDCPKRAEASKSLKYSVLHQYQSSHYVLFRRLKQLRYDLELQFYTAIKDKKQLANMECIRCTSYKMHMEGGCLETRQAAIFDSQAALIRSSILAEFEEYLECRKQLGLDEIMIKQNAAFEAIEECFADSVEDDMESERGRTSRWYDFRLTTIDKNLTEKRTYLQLAESENRAMYQMKRGVIDDTIGHMAHRMSRETAYQNGRLRGDPNLTVRTMIGDARRQLAQMVSDEEKREIQQRRQVNRHAQRVAATEMGLCADYYVSEHNFFRDLADLVRFGVIHEHEFLGAQVRRAMLQFDDSDEDERPQHLNGRH